MKPFGYIVTKNKLKNINGLVWQVDDISKADPTRPILVVGWAIAKSLDGYTTILDKRLGERKFWTFSRIENRMEFENDLQSFYDLVYDEIEKTIHYYYLNIFKIRYSKIKKLLNIVKSMELRNIYINNNMIYIEYMNNVIGISLQILEYIGIKKDKILRIISSNPKNIILNDSSRVVLKLKRALGVNGNRIPCILGHSA